MLNTGTRLGPYEIQSALGAGGMGAVYKARDTRLERTVAVKVLTGGAISDAELRQRFEREARAISALQHPNICVLHDIGNQDGVDYLVMEYVEGETLSQRLRRGPLPIQQVLKIGIEIADALDKAHRAGVVHRDIKPGNIMLTRAGAKLLDFGLAKPLGVQTTSVAANMNSALTALSQGQPLTQEGMIVGTYQYMAPEQIESGNTDGRTDLFALGCVLYEAATGKAAFAGKTQASVIAAVLASDPPPLTSLQPLAPQALERVVGTCLAKDPEDRIHSAHDLKLQLEWLLDANVEAHSVTAGRRGVPWVALLATVVLVVAAAIAGTAGYLRLQEQRQVIRASIDLGDGASIPLVHSMALSPDGKMLAYVAQIGGEKPSLWIRPLQSLRARRVEDTDSASYPFWSPDSRSVAFFVPGKLKKLDTAGWSVDNICDATDARGGAWSPSGTIVFAPDSLGALVKVSASGGRPEAVTTAGPNITHRWPQFLPDGKTFVFFSIVNGDSAGELLKTSVDGGEVTKLRPMGAATWYTDGILLSMRGTTLVAERVNQSTLRASGDTRDIAENVATDSDRWAGDFTASTTGLLLYRESGDSGKVQFSWMDIQTGKLLGAFGEPGSYTRPQISPDGTKLAVIARNPRSENSVLSVMDVTRGVVSPLLPPDAQLRVGGYSWTPDSKSLVFSAIPAQGTHNNLYIKSVDSTEAARLLLSSDFDAFPNAVSSDGHFVLFTQDGGKTAHNDLWLLPLAGDRKPVPLLVTPADEHGNDISGDGRWMLYTSDESGRQEVYLTTFPVPHGRWQVSVNGGSGSAFERNGKHIAVVDSNGKVYSISLDENGPEPKIGQPEMMIGGLSSNDYAGASITPDWKHLAVARRLDTKAPRLTLVTNWLEELKK